MSKILICSSDEETREAIKLILSNYYNLILIDSQQQCIEIIENTEIRILLIDIDKQDAVSEAITKVGEKKPDIKIVALGKNEEAIKSSGANEYILKPIKGDELLESCK